MNGKSKLTIQGRILRALIVLLMAVFLLSGLSLYTIYDAQNSFRVAHQDINRSREHFFDLRVSVDRAFVALEGMGSGKSEGDAKLAESIRRAKTNFNMQVDALHREYPTVATASAAENLKQEFDQAESAGRDAKIRSEKFNAMKRSLDDLQNGITTFHENTLLDGVSTLVYLIISMSIGVLVVPTGAFWLITQRINRDLLAFIRTLFNFSEQNDQTSEALRLASEELSSASGQQSAAVQQTVSSITEIRSMLGETENHIREVQMLTATMNEKTQEGGQIMSRMEASMQAIEQSNSQLASFEEIIQSIRGKTRVINDIVFKTQLLSFNASIEAARAGQYGRGFAVVAEEVGKLAQLSGDASKEIDSLLGDSQNRVVKIVESVEERVSDGKEVSGEALRTFREIASQISAISDKINQVGVAAVEQAGGVEQTARAMDQMNETAHKNKLGSEQILNVSDRVRDLSAHIREVTEGIRQFVREGRDSATNDRNDRSELNSKTPQPIETSTPVRSVPKNTIEDDAVLKLVGRLSQKQSSAKLKKAISSDMSADDPSFRKTSGK